MEKIFFVLGGLIIFKYLLSIFLISRKAKALSYIVEVLISCIIFYFVYNRNEDLYFSIVMSQIEYITMKILVLITVIRLKISTFRLLVMLRRKTVFTVILCKVFDKKTLTLRANRWQKVEYGPRLKLGLIKEAKTRHMKTGVRYDRNGFPIFETFYTYRLPIREWRKSREVHFSRANKFLYKKAVKSKKIRDLFNTWDMQDLRKGKTPEAYTWHHHQSRGKLQLVSREIHAVVDHIGGYSIWGPKTN